MPRGGQNRKPSHLKALKGTDRPSRERETPKPLPIAPDMPDWLDARAQEFWRKMAPMLERQGLLTEIDGPAFAVLCDTYSQIIAATEEIAKDGATVPGTQGTMKKHPGWTIRNQLAQQFRLLCAEFGITPAGRNRLDVDLGAAEDDFDAFLNEKR